VATISGHKIIEHGGGIEGFNTNLSYYPDDKLTVVVLRNVNAPGPTPAEIGHKLAGAAFGETERKEISVDSKVLSRYVGAYQFPGAAMLISLEGNQLLSKLGNQQPVPIFAQSETMFFAKVVDAQIEFPKDEGQAPASQLILHQNGRDIQRSGWTMPRRSGWRTPPRPCRSESRTRPPRREARLRCAS
jgi:hypothetical protein